MNGAHRHAQGLHCSAHLGDLPLVHICRQQMVFVDRLSSYSASLTSTPEPDRMQLCASEVHLHQHS